MRGILLAGLKDCWAVPALALTNIDSTLFSAALACPLEKELLHHGISDDSQWCFKGRRMADNARDLETIVLVQDAQACKHSCLLLTDSGAAAPSVHKDWSMYPMKQMSVPGGIVDLWSRLCKGNMSRIVFKDGAFSCLLAGRGLKQGDPASMLPFAVAMGHC